METYKVIEGFMDYSVSDHGNVKNNKTGKIIKLSVQTDGYIRIGLRLNKVEYKKRVHTLVASAFILNPDAKKCVDHINNDKTNNNISNLRWATYVQNGMNKSMHKNNTSGVRGVYFSKSDKKWRAQISIDGIPIYLGLFTDLEDAKQARMIRANQAFGVFTNACEKII